MSTDIESTTAAPLPGALSNTRWIIESRTTPGVFYHCEQVTSIDWACTCPAGLQGRSCWHVRACIAEKAALEQLGIWPLYDDSDLQEPEPAPAPDRCDQCWDFHLSDEDRQRTHARLFGERDPRECGICDRIHACHCDRLMAWCRQCAEPEVAPRTVRVPLVGRVLA